MSGGEFRVQPEQLQRAGSVFGEVSGQCESAQQGVLAGSLPANAFGRTTHAGPIAGLCTKFQTEMADRIGGNAKQANQLSSGLSQGSAAYQSGDQGAATSYSQVGMSLNGDVG